MSDPRRMISFVTAAPRGYVWRWVPEHALVTQSWAIDEVCARRRRHTMRDRLGTRWFLVLKRVP